MFTEVIDVGMKPKSAIFRPVGTAPAEEKGPGGRNWAGWFLRIDRQFALRVEDA